MAGRVTAHLTSNPVLTDPVWPLCLDALVARRYAIAEFGARFGDGEITAEDCAATDAFDLPIERLDRGDDWVWATSRAFSLDDAGTDVEWHHAQISLDLYERRVPHDTRELVTATAKWKPGRIPQITTVTTALTWLVDTPDPDHLMRILAGVHGVGKNASRGMGAVREWEYEPFPDLVDWAPTLRPLPDPAGPVNAGIRPPYWHPAQRRRVQVP